MVDERQQVQQLISGAVPYIVFESEGMLFDSMLQKFHFVISLISNSGASGAPETGARFVLLSGSFNPLHEGHLGLMQAACRYEKTSFETKSR